MRRRVLVLIEALVLLGLVGCSDKPLASSAAKASKGLTFPIDKLPGDAVVIQVNGKAITKDDYNRWLRMKELTYRLKNRIQLSGVPAGKAGEDFVKFMTVSRVRMIGELVRRELTRQYAEKNGIQATDDLILQAEGRFAAAFSLPTNQLQAVLDRKFSPYDAKALRSLIDAEAIEEGCVRKFATNDVVHVSEQEAAERLKQIKEGNALADKKNAEQRERALAAKKEILGGKYFAEVTERCADLAKEHGKKWETFELGEFTADDPLARWLTSAKAGDISDPIDMDDGLAIVGLVRVYEGKAPEGMEAQTQYEVVRCTFYAYEKREVIEDLAQLAEVLREARRLEALKALGEKLLNEAKIEFPRGEKVFRPANRKGGLGKKDKDKKKKKAQRPGPFKENLKKDKKGKVK